MAHQRVRIVLKPNGTLEARPSRVCISRSAQDQVVWESEVGDATIAFKPRTGSPFVSQIFVAPEGGSVWSGSVVTRDVEIYEYGISVRVQNGKTYSIDPEVQVEP